MENGEPIMWKHDPSHLCDAVHADLEVVPRYLPTLILTVSPSYDGLAEEKMAGGIIPWDPGLPIITSLSLSRARASQYLYPLYLSPEIFCRQDIDMFLDQANN